MSIKKSPADFQVDEVLDPALAQRLAASPAPFALYLLRKENLATPEAASQLARTLHVPLGAIAYAGLKDKYARTSQHLTVRAKDAPRGAPEHLEGKGWKMERLGWLDAPLTSEAIAANRFRIVLRSLDRQMVETMDEAAALLTLETAGGAALRVVNYFGDQRFGSARHGQGFLAKYLIKGDFEGAMRLAIAATARKDRREDKERRRLIGEGWGHWAELLGRLGPRNFPERRALEALARNAKDFRGAFTALPYLQQQLSVYAYQSWLWNAIARQTVAEAAGERGALIEADDPFGTMLFPEASLVPEEFARLELPLLGRKTELREPWKAAAEAVLKAEGITTDELRIPGVRRPFFGEVPRALFADARAFRMPAPQRDEASGATKRFKREVSFELPRGAYATVVLRALGQ